MEKKEENDNTSLKENGGSKDEDVNDEETSDSKHEEFHEENEIAEHHNMENGGNQEAEEQNEPITEMDDDEIEHTTILLHLGWGQDVLEEIETLLQPEDYESLIGLLHSPMGPHFWNEDFQQLISHLNTKLTTLQLQEEEV